MMEIQPRDDWPLLSSLPAFPPSILKKRFCQVKKRIELPKPACTVIRHEGPVRCKRRLVTDRQNPIVRVGKTLLASLRSDALGFTAV